MSASTPEHIDARVCGMHGQNVFEALKGMATV
jgi:hypothetical protein